MGEAKFTMTPACQVAKDHWHFFWNIIPIVSFYSTIYDCIHYKFTQCVPHYCYSSYPVVSSLSSVIIR